MQDEHIIAEAIRRSYTRKDNSLATGFIIRDIAVDVAMAYRRESSSAFDWSRFMTLCGFGIEAPAEPPAPGTPRTPTILGDTDHDFDQDICYCGHARSNHDPDADGACLICRRCKAFID